MTDEELQSYLEDNGYPPHVVAGGRSGLLKRYAEFVEEVERGYEFSLQDYRRDLDGRALLEMLEVGADVATMDDRLRACLTDTGIRIWESMPGDPFWDFGYPANARGRLLWGLKSEGFLAGGADGIY